MITNNRYVTGNIKEILTAATVVSALCLSAGCAPGGGTEPEVPDPISAEDYVPTSADFGCLTDLDLVGNFTVTNLKGDTAAAVALATNPVSGQEYPIGTVIQALPFEAMVKRAPGYAPDNNDWEYFTFIVGSFGTTITSRGVGNVGNGGGPCQDCHQESTLDFVCHDSLGTHCVVLPLTPELIAGFRNSDPRCQN